MRTIKSIAGACAMCAATGLCPGGQDDAGRTETSLQFSFDALLSQPATTWIDPPQLIDPTLGTSRGGGLATLLFTTGWSWSDDADAQVSLDFLVSEQSLYESTGVRVGRSTVLLDGGIEGQNEALSEDPLAGYLSESGEFDLYDISLRIDTLGNDEFGVHLLTGFRAIRAHVGTTSTSIDGSGNEVSTLRKRRGMVAIPVVGAGFQWNPRDEFTIGASASTHVVGDAATYVDLAAEATIRFTHNIGFVAGYQWLHSVMDVRDIEAELSDAGVFARLQIQF